jgi:site-specific recombinase
VTVVVAGAVVAVEFVAERTVELVLEPAEAAAVVVESVDFVVVLAWVLAVGGVLLL